MAPYTEFADLLNQYLTKSDRSASWLAQRLKLYPSTVTRWLNGETRPHDPETIIRIADILGIHTSSERQALLTASGYGYQESNPVLGKPKKQDAQSHPSSWYNKNENESVDSTQPALRPIFPRLVSEILSPQNTNDFDRVANKLLSIFERQRSTINEDLSTDYFNCGQQGINLDRQRLFISSAFGTYFAGLLERQNIYIALPDQIDSPALRRQKGLSPIERIFWTLQHSRGSRVIVIAAEGGMGKSTLAAKIVRCLFEEEAIDMILGDSAKTQRVDLVTGALIETKPGYYDPASCYDRLRAQLGLPPQTESNTKQHTLADISSRLAGRRAIIVIDNLETIDRGDELLHSFGRLVSRDIRAIITTRQARGLQDLSSTYTVVHLRPVTDWTIASKFLDWHIRHYQREHPALRHLEADLVHEERMQRLINQTGGIPLLMQLVFSEIARSSWSYLEALPELFGVRLLNYLYETRWNNLEFEEAGTLARQILLLVAKDQYLGKPVSFNRLFTWAQEQQKAHLLQEALQLLYKRFLIVNHDITKGNFVIFPSLAEFLQRQAQLQNGVQP